MTVQIDELFNGSVINDVINPLTNIRSESLLAFSELLANATIIKSLQKRSNYLYGTGFNPLSQFTLDEHTHTQLLGNLLNPCYPHGQGDLFLISFLNLLDIYLPQLGIWQVQMETGNVDILLKRENPHSVVIVENKSNLAVDQPAQLYRYWHEQIYVPNIGAPGIDYGSPSAYRQDDIRARYKILYLTPSRSKFPAVHSLRRPEWLSHISTLPEVVPLDWEHATYDDLIVRWLKGCKEEVPDTNLRLREYLAMYIEFWNKSFI